jgi:glycosyltransferase involved in cell wall biosynthesis
VPRSVSGVAHAEQSVAVVVTTFNDAGFLEDALNSIVRQARRASEIIVVDDGSDESPEPIVATFPGVVLIQKKNGGLSSARNAGLHAARSEYIAFCGEKNSRFAKVSSSQDDVGLASTTR